MALPHTRTRSTVTAVTSVLATGLMVAGLGLGAAQAETQTEHYPETPKLNPALPIINTYHGSDHIKPNILNPNPVCNSAEDFRTVVYKVDDKFTPAGTISARNKTNKTIPLTQELSKTQTITLSVKGDRTETVSANLGGEVSGDNAKGSAGIAYELAKSVGAEASYSLSWNVGQTVGPYDIPAGHAGEATYGFRTVNMTGTQQICRPNGTWSTPTAWSAFVPVKNEVEVKLYDNLTEAAKQETADLGAPAEEAGATGGESTPAEA